VQFAPARGAGVGTHREHQHLLWAGAGRFLSGRTPWVRVSRTPSSSCSHHSPPSADRRRCGRVRVAFCRGAPRGCGSAELPALPVHTTHLLLQTAAAVGGCGSFSVGAHPVGAGQPNSQLFLFTPLTSFCRPPPLWAARVVLCRGAPRTTNRSAVISRTAPRASGGFASSASTPARAPSGWEGEQPVL